MSTQKIFKMRRSQRIGASSTEKIASETNQHSKSNGLKKQVDCLAASNRTNAQSTSRRGRKPSRLTKQRGRKPNNFIETIESSPEISPNLNQNKTSPSVFAYSNLTQIYSNLGVENNIETFEAAHKLIDTASLDDAPTECSRITESQNTQRDHFLDHMLSNDSGLKFVDCGIQCELPERRSVATNTSNSAFDHRISSLDMLDRAFLSTLAYRLNIPANRIICEAEQLFEELRNFDGNARTETCENEMNFYEGMPNSFGLNWNASSPDSIISNSSSERFIEEVLSSVQLINYKAENPN